MIRLFYQIRYQGVQNIVFAPPTNLDIKPDGQQSTPRRVKRAISAPATARLAGQQKRRNHLCAYRRGPDGTPSLFGAPGEIT